MTAPIAAGAPAPPPQTQRLATPPQRSAGALPETKSPFEIAQQIQEVQVANLKRALDAQTLVLDLLV